MFMIKIKPIRAIKEAVRPYLRLPLKYASILLIKYLQRRYKSISINSSTRQSNQVLTKLKLIQHVLYYFKCQFQAWGYFHEDCVWSGKDEAEFRKLFPKKDFKELEIVVWHNPEAVTYYHNKIWDLSKQRPPNYAREIRKQLIEWKDWN